MDALAKLTLPLEWVKSVEQARAGQGRAELARGARYPESCVNGFANPLRGTPYQLLIVDYPVCVSRFIARS